MTEEATKKEETKPKTMGAPSAAEENAAPYPDMALGQRVHRLTDPAALLEEIGMKVQNAYLYRHVVHKIKESGLAVPASAMTEDQLKALEATHTEKLAQLEKEVEDAGENAGDMEVLDARIAVARYSAQCLDPTAALAAYQKVMDLPKLSTGKKMDALMESARLAFFYKLQGTNESPDHFIDLAEKMSEKGGGDWDRRNRLKVYRALAKLWHRDTVGASPLLLEGMATFSCNELCSYSDFLVYAMLANLLHLERPKVHEKILQGPEILAVQMEIPNVVRTVILFLVWLYCVLFSAATPWQLYRTLPVGHSLTNTLFSFLYHQIKLVKSLYDCEYKEYLHCLVDLEKLLQGDRFLAPHAAYWLRELHILAYHQFLESYSSVELTAMAAAMGVSVEFLDYHASRYIAAGRLSAKIDKYGGVIRTSRPDATNAQYRDVIQKGDLLLNRIQTLARVVDL